MAFDLVDIIFPTGAWGKSFAKVGNFTLQKTILNQIQALEMVSVFSMHGKNLNKIQRFMNLPDI